MKKRIIATVLASLMLLSAVSCGTSAHAIGTVKAMEFGELEGAMSSLSIAVAGLMTVLAASVFANLW